MKNLIAITGLFTLLLPLLAQAGQTAERPEPAVGCTIVAGGGRNAMSSDTQINDNWNRLNFSFFDAAVEAVRACEPVEQAFFPAGSTDAAKNAEVILAQAARSGCTRVAFFSVFSDPGGDDGELVFSMRVAPIRRGIGVPGESMPGAGLSLGAIDYEKEYRFTATPDSLDKVVPSRIADQAVRDYRARRRC